VRAPAALKL